MSTNTWADGCFTNEAGGLYPDDFCDYTRTTGYDGRLAGDDFHTGYDRGRLEKYPSTLPSHDNTFANEFTSTAGLSAPRLLEQPCCGLCTSIVDTAFAISLSDTSESCEICCLLRRAAGRSTTDGAELRLIREGSCLRIAPHGPRVAQLYSFPGTQTFQGIQDTQVGLPDLPKSGEPAYTELLKTWLDSCNGKHEQCKPQSNSSQTAVPTRLINVGTLKSPKLQLCVTEKDVSYKYVALSYCWGELTKDNKASFCTTKDNYVVRQEAFEESVLPKTHQDAVWVCRNLGIEYIWIDSHCIIQLGDGGLDWEHEALLMENVYASAYCVFAVVSATGVDAGFLGRESEPESEPQSIYVRDHSDRRFYVSTNVEAFDQHVEEGPLNKRAWVMQERYLARRTLHFAADQVYWECGEEMYCGNLAQLERYKSGRGFASDPYFPSMLAEKDYYHVWTFIQYLLQDYSQRKLAEPNDRRFAMAGLEKRIATVLKCKSSYGVFEKYLHRNLLWYLAPPDSTGTRSVPLGRDIPSWSWMAHSGGIKFVEVPFVRASWIKQNFLWFEQERDGAITASLGEIVGCSARPCNNCTGRHCEARHEVVMSAGKETGWVRHDSEGNEEPNTIQCVVVGRKAAKKDDPAQDYVLLVRPTGAHREYKRVGVGQVQTSCVAKQKKRILLV